jgi:hypothetical protein
VIDGIQCTRCGWHNEATAIMCGGCGQPLRATPQIYPPQATLPWSQAPSPPVAPAPQRVSSPQDAPTWPMVSGKAPAPVQRAAPTARPRGSCCLSGCLWSLLITLALLVALAVGVWSLVLRPALHAQADAAFARGIGTLVADVPPIPERALQVTGPSVTVSEAISDVALQQGAAAMGAHAGLSVRYEPGVVLVRYDENGNTGQVSMQPRVRDGHIVVENVHVTGVLGWIESGQELQATLNRELAPLAAKTPHGFAAVSVANGQLTVTLKTA